MNRGWLWLSGGALVSTQAAMDLIHSSKREVKNEGEIQAFSDKLKLEDFNPRRSNVREILKSVFQAEENDPRWKTMDIENCKE